VIDAPRAKVGHEARVEGPQSPVGTARPKGMNAIIAADPVPATHRTTERVTGRLLNT
jgi:hypothetical protein